MLKTLTILLMVAITLVAKDVKLVWDANDPAEQVKYNIYEKNGANYILVAANIATNTYTITNVPPGKHVYVATATNYWGESAYSNEAATPNTPTNPKNLKTE